MHIEANNISAPERDLLVGFIKRLSDAGHPLAVVVVIDDILLANAVVPYVRNVVFRSWIHGQMFNPGACDTPEHAAAHADFIYDQHWPVVSQLVGVKYVQFRNESSEFPHDNYFELQLMKRADANRRFKVGMYGDSLGSPEVSQWQTREASLAYAMANGHIVVIHEYGAMISNQPANVPVSDPATRQWYGTRHEMLYASVPANCRPNLIIGETGTSDGYTHGAATIDDMRKYNEELQAYPYVLGYAWWGFGNSMYHADVILPQFETLALGLLV